MSLRLGAFARSGSGYEALDCAQSPELLLMAFFAALGIPCVHVDTLLYRSDCFARRDLCEARPSRGGISDEAGPPGGISMEARPSYSGISHEARPLSAPPLLLPFLPSFFLSSFILLLLLHMGHTLCYGVYPLYMWTFCCIEVWGSREK